MGVHRDEGISDRTHVRFPYIFETAQSNLSPRSGLQVREEFLLVTPPAGNAVRRSLVRGVRSFSARATAQAFLFVAEPAVG